MFVLASNYFRKCFSVNAGVWLRMENKFSRKYFQLIVKLRPLTRKMNAGFVLPSNHFQAHRRAEREREREREREKEESRESELDRAPPQTRRRDHAVEFVPLRSSALSFSLLIDAVITDLVLVAHRRRCYRSHSRCSSAPSLLISFSLLIDTVVTDLVLILDPKLIGAADLVVSISSHQ